MTTFQTIMLAYVGDMGRNINGCWIMPHQIRRNADLAARLYWLVN